MAVPAVISAAAAEQTDTKKLLGRLHDTATIRGSVIVLAQIAHYHLPGLFEFYNLYGVFFPLYRKHRDWFYEWCDIGSVYGAPASCVWGGGRVGFGEDNPREVLQLMRRYGVSARLTFSNMLLREEHLSDRQCNTLCEMFSQGPGIQNGVIIASDLLLQYLQVHYPTFYFVSSTTKVLTEFEAFRCELQRTDFSYVVPDFRLNHAMENLKSLSSTERAKVEFLCNECCSISCLNRKACYERVSQKNLGEPVADFPCSAPDAADGYRFSKAMQHPAFIGIDDIQHTYLPLGFSNFKLEGRSLGTAVVLEFLLYYMTKPEYQLRLREEIYLNSNLDLF